MTNHLYYGDNLGVLRESIRDESVDLVYLDPPFNSNATYNILFRAPSGEASQAQIEAFEDTWHWNDAAERAFDDVMQSGNAQAADMLRALRSFLRDNDMMAYIAHISVRMLELHRVLKPTGSIYLHCDPTASHYLKVMMDAVFGVANFRNEIIWKRTFAHGGADRWGDVHDTLFFYSKSNSRIWHKVLQRYDEGYVDNKYRFSDERGQYRLVVLTGSGVRGGESGKEWRGYDPTAFSRHWAVPKAALDLLQQEGVAIPNGVHDRLELLFQQGLIRFPEKSDGSLGVPEFRFYLPKGQPIQDVITDIPPINSQAKERLGYPTQKPLALLERIVAASSDEGDVVLDPFCGCGTTVHAANKLRRRWIGIDVTHLAISVIEKRLRDAFPGIAFAVHGSPKDLDGARDLAARDKYQFQWWAVSLVNAAPQNSRKKGADGGIDGVVFFKSGARTTEKAIVSVKGGHVGVKDVRELANVVDREKAKIGVFISLEEHTQPMVKEAAGAGLYDGPTGKVPKIQLFTIEELLAGERPKIPLVERAFKVTGVELMEEQDEFDL
jgi:site-specific DNA-methyltransferase (adenine-specific)